MKKLLFFSFLSFPFLLFSQSIVFSELNYNSDTTANSGNWVELWNYGTVPLSIGSWSIKDDDNSHIFTIPPGTTLQPDARLVVCNDLIKFQSQYPSVTNYIGTMNFSLSNTSDQVRLFDNNNTQILFMQYADSFPWPKAADGAGRTLELLNPAGTLNDPANWFVGCMGGSPGTAWVPCNDEIVFSEINYNSEFVASLEDELNRTGKVSLEGIGKWFFDLEKKLHFIPASSPNYLLSSYGLDHFVSPPVMRMETVQQYDKRLVDVRKEKKKRKLIWFRF